VTVCSDEFDDVMGSGTRHGDQQAELAAGGAAETDCRIEYLLLFGQCDSNLSSYRCLFTS
jgi:hypothetical protein